MSTRPKKRLDVLLVELGFASTRKKAQALILAHHVLVEDIPITKPGHMISEGSDVRVRKSENPYVSRGGEKLKHAVDTFLISAQGRVALDIGSSTGGFTDVLLQEGVEKVFAVDVGTNQLAWKLRNDSRVTVMEKVNARNLSFTDIGQKVDIIVMDVSFISILKIIPSLLVFSHSKTDWVTLIKPQFEAGREQVGKGGIVKSAEVRQEVIDRVTQDVKKFGLTLQGLIESPIKGTEGNIEFLAYWKQEENCASPYMPS